MKVGRALNRVKGAKSGKSVARAVAGRKSVGGYMRKHPIKTMAGLGGAAAVSAAVTSTGRATDKNRGVPRGIYGY